MATGVPKYGADGSFAGYIGCDTELRRAGVTLELLHLSISASIPTAIGIRRFACRYRQWVDRQRLSMRQVHTAGEKLFVDYSGKKPAVVDPATGVVRSVELFVAVLGASNYTYVEATDTQRSADFIQIMFALWPGCCYKRSVPGDSFTLSKGAQHE